MQRRRRSKTSDDSSVPADGRTDGRPLEFAGQVYPEFIEAIARTCLI